MKLLVQGLMVWTRLCLHRATVLYLLSSKKFRLEGTVPRCPVARSAGVHHLSA